MRTFRAALLLLLLTAPALADAAADATALYARGEQAIAGGDGKSGVTLIENAAEAGSVAAQLRLAKLSETGTGPLPRDRARAFRLVSAIADRYADADYYDANRRIVAEAFDMLATYHHLGLPEAGVASDPAMAARLRYHAATVFRDPQAQFKIGRMYLDGDGVTANLRMATTFLGYAARSRHAPAQAIYGSLIWEGKGVRRAAAQGLALLALATVNADESDRGWIETLYRAALKAATPAEIAEAQRWADANSESYRRQPEVPLRIGEEGDATTVGDKPRSETVPPATIAEAGPLAALGAVPPAVQAPQR